MTDEPIDGDAADVSHELVPHQQPVQPSNLFRTDDPVQVVQEATKVANALKQVLVNQGMLQRIGPKDHVRVEGWTTLGAMMGVVPVVVWTRKIEPNIPASKLAWEARVEARTLDGRVVGAAEAMCSREEKRWQDADEYAVRSMAQTRATSKALASPLRFIVTLAGFEGTPAEEMPTEPRYGAPGASTGASSGGDTASGKQQGMIRGLVREKAVTPDALRLELDRVGGSNVQIAKGWTKKLTVRQASALIDALQHLPTPDPNRPSDLDNDTSGFGPVEGAGPQDQGDAGVPVTEDPEPLPFDGPDEPSY